MVLLPPIPTTHRLRPLNLPHPQRLRSNVMEYLAFPPNPELNLLFPQIVRSMVLLHLDADHTFRRYRGPTVLLLELGRA